MKIQKLLARQIYDSRGYPTVEVDLYLDDGSFGRASVPSGASTGSHEALELRDEGKDYGGKGVSKALRNCNVTIAHALVGKSYASQQELDKTLISLDGTEHKSKLGANAILAVSLAFARASAAAQNIPLFLYVQRLAGVSEICLPVPYVNVLNGGKHAAGGLSVQECMIVPHGAKDFQAALTMASEIFHALGLLLAKQGKTTTVGDEGGFAPALSREEDGLDLLVEAITAAGFHPGKDVSLAMDVAASELLKDEKYHLGKQTLSTDDMIAWLQKLATKYPIISIEDGLAEDDWQGWQKLTTACGSDMQIIGDDLFVTNANRLQLGIDKHAANSILIKPNQIGTLTETIETVLLAKANGYRAMVSHRSGETEDTSIAHIAVGLGVGQIKTGSFSRTDRLTKYNELLRIAELAPHIAFGTAAK
jgi:enolase